MEVKFTKDFNPKLKKGVKIKVARNFGKFLISKGVAEEVGGISVNPVHTPVKVKKADEDNPAPKKNTRKKNDTNNNE